MKSRLFQTIENDLKEKKVTRIDVIGIAGLIFLKLAEGDITTANFHVMSQLNFNNPEECDNLYKGFAEQKIPLDVGFAKAVVKFINLIEKG